MVKYLGVWCLGLLSWGAVEARGLPLCAPDTLSSSIVFMPDSLVSDSLRYEFAGLKEVAYRRKWSRQLYRLIFVSPPRGNIEVIEAENSEIRYKPYRDRVIREVHVKVLPPFGTSIRDTSYARDSARWFEAMGNSIHQRTSERLVKRHLTVRPGDRVVPFELVQNELLLKRLSNIDDALIRVVEVDSAAVELHVICRDEFSWTGSGSTNFIYNAEVGIENRNLWGMGHLAHYESIYRGHKEQKWGHKAEYAIRNLFSSRWDFHGNYEDTHENHLFTLELEKEFLTASTRWAGGVAFKRIFSSSLLVDKDIVKPVELFNYSLVDLWGGYSRQWPQRYTFNQNVFVTARYSAIRFNDRPTVSPDSNHFYYNRDTYIGAVSYIKLKYFKANLIHDFGRAEEIPSGLYGTLLVGYEKQDFEDFLYLGSEWVYSWYNVHADRFYSLSAALGTFFNAYKMESGVFKMNGSYISPLYRFGKNRFRLYARADYTCGIHRNPGDSIYFRKRDIHGFDNNARAMPNGTRRLSASLSTTLFLSRIKWGFRTSLSAYSDMGMLVSGKALLWKRAPYWGLGVSLNLRNDNVIFKNLSVRLAYYPRITSDLKHLHVSAYTSRENGFHDYKVRAPGPVRYE
ncbi:MAG: hypothetical protein LBP56_02270 [Odoribacteraceae bacterium]|jgi:hypothetical protein|nr:hypothetical protein [Odoribacteraceae bacterium]